MAMKKAEMETHKESYHALMVKARTSQRSGLYREAVEAAFSSWEFIDGMMQYERRYEEREFDGIEAIDLVLRYSPLLLDFAALEKLELLLKDNKRIDKNTNENLAKRLSDGKALLTNIHRLWNYLEHHPGAFQNELHRFLGGQQTQWRAAAEDWERMGLLRRKPDAGSYRLELATRMGEIVPAKCTSCGEVSNAPKAMLLEATTCPNCSATVSFVLIARQRTSD